MRVGIRTQVLATLLAVLVFGLVASYLVTSRVTRGVVLDARVAQAKEVATLAAARFSGLVRTPEALSGALDEVRALAAPDWVWLLDSDGVSLSVEDEDHIDPALVASLLGVVAQHRVVEVADGRTVLVVVAPVRPHARAVSDDVPEDEQVDKLERLSLVWLSDVTPTLAQVGRIEGLFILFSVIISALAVILGYVLLGRAVVQPVYRLMRNVERFETGEGAPKRAGRLPSGELGDLTQAFERFAARLAEDRARIEQQIRELTFANREIAAQQEQLVRTGKLASVGELAAGVAHEIGNPIAVLQGYIEMLADPDLPPETRSTYLETMDSAVRRVSTIIRDLLEFARPVTDTEDGGDAVLAVRKVDQLLSPQRRLQHVTLTVEVGAETAAVPIPSIRLEQILINLLFNAADATPEGGHVRLGLTVEPDAVVLEVADDGPGIPLADQDRIFDPFFTTKDPGEGTGLGLAICHGLLQTYGGTIQFETAEGEGTLFRITLPVGPCRPPEDRSP
jgi:two-component system, NtrC family, sensor kinase